MRTIIIEDENLTARRLEKLLQESEPGIRIEAILPSVIEAVLWLRKNEQPDLIFMDIHLEDDLAFRIFEQVRVTAPVIFTTAYDEYMIKAFKVNSIDYLLKPVNPDELQQALAKFKTLRDQFAKPRRDNLLELIAKKEPEYKSRFMITAGNRIRSVEIAEVAYFYSEEKLTFLATRDGHFLPIEFSLDKLITLLDPKAFFRISRQYIISFSAIQSVVTHLKGKLKLELKPRAKTEVLVSSDRASEFKTWLGR